MPPLGSYGHFVCHVTQTLHNITFLYSQYYTGDSSATTTGCYGHGGKNNSLRLVIAIPGSGNPRWFLNHEISGLENGPVVAIPNGNGVLETRSK